MKLILASPIFILALCAHGEQRSASSSLEKLTTHPFYRRAIDTEGRPKPVFPEKSVVSNSKTGNEIDEGPIPQKTLVPTDLDFSCNNRAPGYYSDPSPQSKCQVYHMCMSDGRKYSMLCGIGTVFNQVTFVCDHWYNYRCSDAETDYTRNDRLWNEFLTPLSSQDEEEDYPDEAQSTVKP